jgi:hypothetical protein
VEAVLLSRGKIDGLDSKGGGRQHVVWLLLPPSDDLEAIGHSFNGRLMMDGSVSHETMGAFVHSSQK